MRGHHFTEARALKCSKVSKLPRREREAQAPSANNNIIYRIYCLFNNNNNSHFRAGPNIHQRGVTLRIGILLPLRGRSVHLANVYSTYPIPSYPALFHTDTSLHGAPTVEDTYLCTSWFLVKSAIEQTTKSLKTLSLFLFHVLVSYERCHRVNDGNVKYSIIIFMKLTKLKLT